MQVLKLLVRNTGEHLIIDPKHWTTVKDVAWVFKQGEPYGCQEDVVKDVAQKYHTGSIVSSNGITYEELCGSDFKGLKNKYNDIYDKRRENLIPKDKDWTYSEYYGKFKLI